MNTLFKDLLCNGSIRKEFHKLHLLRKIYITASCVLFINRSDHDLISKKQLVFHMYGNLILRINKAQRPEIHIIVQSRLHIFTVKIWNKTISYTDHMTEILHIFKLVAFLLSGTDRCMITHQRCEYSKCQETEQQLSCGISAKSPQICSCIQETTHIQRRHHLQVQENMRPPGFIVTGPDSTIAVHTNVRRSGEHQETFLRIDPFKSFPRCPGHIVAKQVVHFVMADLFTIYIMIKSPVIFRIVGNITKGTLHLPDMDLSLCIFCKFPGKLFDLFHSLCGIKNCRLVHIVPETVDSLLNQETVFVTEPFSGIFIQHIREMGISRPYSCHKVTAILSLAEITIFNPFLINIVSRLHFDASINNGDQTDILIFQFLYKLRKILEILFV